ncbi:hypothetical protein [Amycolatopsis sp. BJA-103]|uniref:hypothetical protein n=1 Tax=Amycolatopsis sp. BJA-103 TaxID=1911175 RepID=UPI0011AF1BEB|nr:hypothetical protein [Amycolatopsis sp. BJA-103]
MKPGRGKRSSADRDRAKRLPRVAGRPLSSSDVDDIKSLASQTVHEEVAGPLIEKLSHFKVRALGLSVLWLIFFVICRASDVPFPLSFFAFLGFPVCLAAAWLWRSRYRSASKTGLREATATVRPGWLFPRIDVFFENDYKFLATRRSLRIAPRVRKVPVFVGGEGTDMIVIFPRGRFAQDTLYAVPVKEIEPDTA